MGAYRKFHFRKKFLESVLIHAVDISTCIHFYHDVVVVGPFWVAHYGKLEVFSFHQCGCHHHSGGLGQVEPSAGSFLALENLVEISYFVTVLALGILYRTPLPWLVFMFPTSHALVLHPWGFSRLMSRIRRSLLSGFILCPWLSISCILLVLALLVLPMVTWNKVHRSYEIQ